MFDLRSVLLGAGLGAATALLLCARRRRGLPPRGLPRQAAPVDTTGVLSAGKAAVIIGSGSGIGRAAALRCVALGMKVMLADIDVADATAVRDECIAAGAPPDTVVVQPCDCTREEQVRAAGRTRLSAGCTC